MPELEIQDAYGNTVLGSTTTIKAAQAYTNGVAVTSGASSTVDAVDGLATFSGPAALTLNNAGNFKIRFSVDAVSSSITDAVSNTFAVTAADPKKVAFTTHPSNVTSRGVFGTTPVLEVQDAGGNAVIGTTTTSVTLEAVPASGSATIFISGNTGSSLGGLITFPNLRVGAPIGSYTLRVASITNSNATFSAAMVGGQSSNAFTISHGAVAKLAIDTKAGTAATVSNAATDSGRAGVELTRQPVVLVQDADGNTVTNSSLAVTATINNSGTLRVPSNIGSTTVSASSGVVNFAGLNVTGATGTYTLKYALVTDASVFVDQANFSLTGGAPHHLAISVQPSNAVSGVSFDATDATAAPKVVIKDQWNNTVTDATNAVTPVLVNATTGLVVGETKSGVAASSGIATFSGLTYNKSGTSRIRFEANGLTSITSSDFTITPGAVDRLDWLTDPGSETSTVTVKAGSELSVKPVLHLVDAAGNRVTTGTWTVTINAVLIDPDTGALTSTLLTPSVGGTETSSLGVVTFSNLVVAAPAGTYRLKVVSASQNLTSAGLQTSAPVAFGPRAVIPTYESVNDPTVTNDTSPSSPIVFTYGEAHHVEITGGEAAGARAGKPFTTMPVATIRDIAGNIVNSYNSGTIQVAAVGATLAGHIACDIRSGVADFAKTDGSCVSTSGGTYAKDMQLTGSTGSVTLTYRVAGQSLILTDSHTISLAAGDPSKIAMVVQPANIDAGADFSPAVTTQVQDAYGNSIATGQYTTAVKPVLYDTATATSDASKSAVSNTSGAHTWTNPGFTKAGTYRLQFTGSATSISSGAVITLTPAESDIFNISAATPSRLAFKSLGSLSVAARATFGTTPVVQLTDDYGNVVKNDTTTRAITISAIASDSSVINGSAAGNFISGNTANASAGEFSFPDLKVGAAIGSYTLKVTSVTRSSGGTLTKVDSGAFTLTAGAVNQLAKTTNASGAAAGKPFTGQPVIEIRDADNNKVELANAQIQLTSNDAEVFNTATITTSNGVANFGSATSKVGLRGSTVGTKTIKFSLVSDPTIYTTQTGITLTAGDAYKLSVGVAPVDITAGNTFTDPVTVGVVDAWGNAVSTSVSVTAGLADGVSRADLVDAGIVGDSATTNSSGVATFSTLKFTRAGASRIKFVAGNLVTYSDAFNIAVAAPHHITWDSLGQTSVANRVAFTTAPVATLRDAYENLVSTGYTASATIGTTTGTNHANATNIVQNATRIAVGGTFTFENLVVAAKVDTYKFRIASISVTQTVGGASVSLNNSAAQSDLFAVTHGAANKVTVITDASGAAAGKAFTTQPIVEVQDQEGNPVTTGAAATAAITMAPAASANSNGAISTTVLNATAGRANFQTAASSHNLGIWGTAGAQTLNFTATFGTSPTTVTGSQAITLSAGDAYRVVVGTQPARVEAGQVFDTAPTAKIQDDYGNTVTSATDSVVATLYKGASAVSPAVTSTKSATSGVASFNTTSFTVTRGTDYSMVYSVSGLVASPKTSTFEITNGAARTVEFTTAPVAIGAGISYGTFVSNTQASDAVPAIRVIDAANNVINSDPTAVGSEAVLTVRLVNPNGSAITDYATGVTSANLLSGTSVTTTNGVANLSALTIRAKSGNYKLIVSASVDGTDVPYSAEATVTVRNGVLSFATINNATDTYDPVAKESVAARTAANTNTSMVRIQIVLRRNASSRVYSTAQAIAAAYVLRNKLGG